MLKNKILTVLASVLVSLTTANAVVVITEFAYGSVPGEFVEFTNMGAEPVDFSGWRFEDDSADYAQGFDLSGFGVVQPGESVLITEAMETDFRTAWNLAAGVKILGGVSNNLGRADTIVLFNGAQQEVTRLAYGDQTYPGTVRTNGVSAWTTADNLGVSPINNKWVLSTLGDLQGSYANTSGELGNPGVYVIPEPSTYAAIAAALIMGVAIWRKRK